MSDEPDRQIFSPYKIISYPNIVNLLQNDPLLRVPEKNR